MTQGTRTVSRRGFLRTAVGAGAVSASTGAAVAQDGTTHTVEMTDGLVFDPEAIAIEPGDTVVWENVGSIGHSVTAYEDELPAEAEYFASGDFDEEQAARDAYPEGDIGGGESYQHTFDVEGTYDYFCIPHEGAGMLGTISVGTGGETAAGGEGGGGGIPIVPDSARTLALFGSAGVLSIAGLAYFFMKYGGDYAASDEG